MAGHARHDVVEVRFGTIETGSPKLDRVGRGGTAKTRPFDRLRDLRLDVPTGNTYSSPGWVRWPGRHAGKRSQKVG